MEEENNGPIIEVEKVESTENNEKTENTERVERKAKTEKTEKRLHRVQEGKMLAGVCNGLAEYFVIDVTLVRLGWALLTLAGGCGILAYIIAIIVMPSE